MEVSVTNAHFLNQVTKQFTKLKIPQMSKRLSNKTSKSCPAGEAKTPPEAIPVFGNPQLLHKKTGEVLKPGFYNMENKLEDWEIQRIKAQKEYQRQKDWQKENLNIIRLTELDKPIMKQIELDFDQRNKETPK